MSMAFSLVPYKKQEQAYDSSGKADSARPEPVSPKVNSLLINPLLLFLFALLGATVDVSDSMERFPWLDKTVRIILGFGIPIAIAICVVYAVIAGGRRLLHLHPNSLRVLTFAAMVCLILLNSYILYSIQSKVTAQGATRPPVHGADTDSTAGTGPSSGWVGPLTTACPGEEQTFVGIGKHKDELNVMPGHKVTVDFVLQNTGSVEWRNRYLQRWGQHDNPSDLRSEARIPILVTPRGKRTVVTVRLTAPQDANTYTAYFKIVNEKGEFCYPPAEPLEATFTVVEQSDLNPSS
ncbi:MAG TPA: NBR1-Ig-like domain-containing protein [Longimicrobium sp.]